jgi:hypothetical protein
MLEPIITSNTYMFKLRLLCHFETKNNPPAIITKTTSNIKIGVVLKT